MCKKIAVPLQKQTYKKIDSEQVREGNVKRTQYKENETDFETSIYKHLEFSYLKITKYFCIMGQRVKV